MSDQRTLAFRDIADQGYRLHLIRATILPAAQKAVLRSIYDHGGHRAVGDNRGHVKGCFASHETIAVEVGFCVRTVGQAVRQLKAAGLIHARKIGQSGGAIIEDKRIVWSNLDALFAMQQGLDVPAEDESIDVEPPRREGIDPATHPAIETASHPAIDPATIAEETLETIKPKKQEPTPPSPPKPRTGAGPDVDRLPEGWEGVFKTLVNRGVLKAKALCCELAGRGVPIALADKRITKAGANANGGALRVALRELGPDDVERWNAEQRARRRKAAQKIIADGKACKAPRWQVEKVLADEGLTFADAEPETVGNL